jgi:hypothetical protein
MHLDKQDVLQILERFNPNVEDVDVKRNPIYDKYSENDKPHEMNLIRMESGNSVLSIN